MILADTSVWIKHLRKGHPVLARLLERREIFLHPLVSGELACSNLKNRRLLIEHLSNLPRAVQASDSDVMEFLELRKLWARGIGWIDLHLLASTLLSNCKLWTLDQRLHEIAAELGVAYLPTKG